LPVKSEIKTLKELLIGWVIKINSLVGFGYTFTKRFVVGDSILKDSRSREG
jgi:hypothetical protein